MSTPQELIDYVKQDSVRLFDLIAQEAKQKLSIDEAIAQQQADIEAFRKQQVQCDENIKVYELDIIKNEEIIVIIAAKG